MSINPYGSDSTIKSRIEAFEESVGAAVRAEIAAACLAPGRLAANLGGILPADDAARIIDRFRLTRIDDVMLLGLGVAQTIARPPISGFHVGAIGLEAETGNLVLGGNVEFPRTHLGYTLHGETFVFTRAFSRGTSIRRIALGEAHPCAHCRQYLSEFALGPDLELIDPLGHQLTLGDLYPWPFDSRYLGQPGAMPGAVNFPALAPTVSAAPSPAINALLAAGRRAHAPYSGCPGAVVLELADGKIIAGASIESVAFNPTMGPLQAALVDLIAHGYRFDDVVRATLGTVAKGAVDYSLNTRELLGAIAPGVALDIIDWRP
ncbi:hypothetical protein [Pleomorphomonas sp. PLEO]|uniref:hypothetical protein n=1 Tax=Pleomorphomonas sp. PLEO TaxID=3239306 RepID=UPI00351DB308